MITFTLLNQSRSSTNPRMMDPTVSVPSKGICSCYRTVPSAIWEIFSEFLIFCNLFFELLGERNNSKIWKTRKISANIRQIFHALLFNIRNYSPEVINIKQRKAELVIILPRVSNFNIKQKKVCNICFTICHLHQTRSGKIKNNKTQQISVKRQFFFS